VTMKSDICSVINSTTIQVNELCKIAKNTFGKCLPSTAEHLPTLALSKNCHQNRNTECHTGVHEPVYFKYVVSDR
jgi:hypothetical protein